MWPRLPSDVHGELRAVAVRLRGEEIQRQPLARHHPGNSVQYSTGVQMYITSFKYTNSCKGVQNQFYLSPGHSALYSTVQMYRLVLCTLTYLATVYSTVQVYRTSFKSYLATVYRCTLIRSSTGGSEYSDTSCEGSNIPGNSFS